jgi:pilus assembly protein Flp/PilA
MRLISRIWHDQEGATSIEYGMVVALLALAITGGLYSLGNAASDTFTGLAGTNQSAIPETSTTTPANNDGSATRPVPATGNHGSNSGGNSAGGKGNGITPGQGPDNEKGKGHEIGRGKGHDKDAHGQGASSDGDMADNRDDTGGRPGHSRNS